MDLKTDPSGNVTSYTYSVSGLLVSATAPDGSVKTISYDSINGVSTINAPDGGIWVHKYDTVFNVPLEVSITYSGTTYRTRYIYDSKSTSFP